MAPYLTLSLNNGEKLAARIPPPEGLVNDPNPDRSQFVVLFITPRTAEAIYAGMELVFSDKVVHRLDDMRADARSGAQPRCELPFIGGRGVGNFEVRNDAYVLKALATSGAERVPVVAHIDDAAALIGSASKED